MVWEKTIKEEWTNKNYSNDNYSYICSLRRFEYLPFLRTHHQAKPFFGRRCSWSIFELCPSKLCPCLRVETWFLQSSCKWFCVPSNDYVGKMECNRRPSDIENINEISFFLFEEILCRRRSELAYELQNGKFFRREIERRRTKFKQVLVLIYTKCASCLSPML